MRAHYFQHVPFEGLGSIGPWLEGVGYGITATRFHQGESLPDLDGVDLLIVLGGPMSVNDEDRFPWLAAEKRFIRRAAEAGIPVLGICLGAQLIVAAFGGRVYRNRVPEIGWFPVQGVGAGGDVFRFPAVTEVFHWHGETFDLPTGAIHLARGAACENQAFQLGSAVIGLQFHLETTPESAREILMHCRDELIPSPYVQSETAILSVSMEKYKIINSLMGKILFFLVKGQGNCRIPGLRPSSMN